jgi:hypothetical protein
MLATAFRRGFYAADFDGAKRTRGFGVAEIGCQIISQRSEMP